MKCTRFNVILLKKIRHTGRKTKRILVGYKIKFFLRPILNSSQIFSEGIGSSRTYHISIQVQSVHLGISYM